MNSNPTSNSKVKEKKEIKLFLENIRHWNGGAGLIVPESVGKWLKDNKIDAPYTVSEKLPVKKVMPMKYGGKL
jgi:hypothetical protein